MNQEEKEKLREEFRKWQISPPPTGAKVLSEPEDDVVWWLSQIDKILAAKAEEEQKIIAGVIVDLYEMRASTMLPYKPSHFDKVEDAFKYNFFSSAIAQICDKHKVPTDVIQEVIRDRQHKATLQVLTPNSNE